MVQRDEFGFSQRTYDVFAEAVPHFPVLPEEIKTLLIDLSARVTRRIMPAIVEQLGEHFQTAGWKAVVIFSDLERTLREKMVGSPRGQLDIQGAVLFKDAMWFMDSLRAFDVTLADINVGRLGTNADVRRILGKDQNQELSQEESMTLALLEEIIVQTVVDHVVAKAQDLQEGAVQVPPEKIDGFRAKLRSVAFQALRQHL